MDDIYKALEKLAKTDGRGVLAEILETEGSAPRHAGARMLLSPDGAFSGTVGGGAVEYRVQQDMKSLPPSFEALEKTYSLGGEGEATGAICGGSARIRLRPVDALEAAALLEKLPKAPRVLLYGAGHVAKSLADALHLLDISVTVTDDRAALLTAERFPFAERLISPPESAPMRPQPEDFIVIMTHDHRFDYALLRRAMETDARYIGVMASRKKAELFRRRLEEDGFSPKQIRRLHSPIGLAIGAETPAEIAVSIAGEIISILRGETE